MDGEVAQLIALTCYGNASINGIEAPQHFRDNSTCQHCESIQFFKRTKLSYGSIERMFYGRLKKVRVSKSPDHWFAYLHKKRVKYIKLFHQGSINPRFPDRTSVAFVGGGGRWTMELVKSNGKSEHWVPSWELGDRDSPSKRSWRVNYILRKEIDTAHRTAHSIDEARTDFRGALLAILDFSQRHTTETFTQFFSNALEALDDHSVDGKYHNDLTLPNQLSVEAESLLKAAVCAWVFGGMGSWNDVYFPIPAQEEYDMVTDRLFNTINNSIQIATNSSARTIGVKHS